MTEDEKPTATAEEPVFDFGKKKRKKKAVVAEETAPVEAPVEEEVPVIIPEPTPIKEIPSTPEVVQEKPADAAAVDVFSFGEKKKKKKKPDVAMFEAELKANEFESGFGGEDLEETGAQGPGGVTSTETEAAAGEDVWLSSNRDYTYPELLSRVFRIIRQNNPDLVGEKKKYTLVPPQVLREGTKKTIFANVADLAKRMRREPDHLIQYLFAELGTTGSIDGSHRLVIKGRWQQKQIESVLKRYIVEYVTCKTCKSGDTILSKENRLFFLQCQSCGSRKTVSAIKTGFMAQTQKRS
ncbi:hypothetical protein HDU76_009660, partial [Blyttiomyces sp. JEL0837]